MAGPISGSPGVWALCLALSWTGCSNNDTRIVAASSAAARFGPAETPAARTPPAPQLPPEEAKPKSAAGAQEPDSPGFLGSPDAPVLQRLRSAPIERIKRGSGGRSLGFKVYFEGGGKAYYKPEQTFSGANWYAELAAYYLDRALGLGRVPTVAGRRMPWGRLKAVAAGDKRLKEAIVGEDGSVRGALVDWVQAQLGPARTPPGWENWIRVEPYPRWSITPYQRPAVLASSLKRRKERLTRGETQGERYYDSVPDPDRPELAAELSDMLVFDFLTINIDRWGGKNVNVLTAGTPGPLIFLDNAAGFSLGPHRRHLMDGRLKVCQRFRRRTIDALRALDVKRLGRSMGDDTLAPVLSEHLLEGIAVRRQAVLEHVATLQAAHGDAVFPW